MSDIGSLTFNDLRWEFISFIEFVTSRVSLAFIYPFVGRTKNVIRCYKIMRNCIIITIFQLTTSLIRSKFQNWFEIINIAPNLGVCILILIKYTKIHTKRDFYESFFKHFKVDLWEVINMESKEHKEIFARNIRVSRKLILFQYYYMFALIAVVVTFPRIIMFIDSKILGNDIKYLYPFDGWYPFDKVKWYNLIYVWESIMTAVVISLYVACDVLHISLSRLVCMELNILGSTMINLITREDRKNIFKRRLAVDTHTDIKIKLKSTIKSHQVLVGYGFVSHRFVSLCVCDFMYGQQQHLGQQTGLFLFFRMAADLENVLGSGMLLIYIFGSIFLCLTILTALMVEDLYLSLRYFSFFLSLFVEVFIQCMIGQILFNHSQKLEQAIYFSNWSYTDKETRQMLHIFLIRAQRPLKLSANGYLNMNLNTFGGICRMSYQLFNLLRTAYS